MEENTEKPTTNDALEYIKHVKQVLRLNEGKNKYDQFGSALDQFHHQKISAKVLLAQVETLFDGHKILLSGFKIFLPKKQETKSVIRIVRRNKRNSSYESKKQSCHEFLERVRVRFAGNLEVYSSFLETMIKYESGNKLNVTQLSEKIFTLLIGHADLVYEFECFFNDQNCETRKDVEKIRVWTIDNYMNDMEVVLLNLRTLIRRVKEALELLKLDPWVGEVQDPFMGRSFRCFERFYGEFGLEKIDAMKNSPKEDFPVIFTQLKNKEEELLKYRSCAQFFLIKIHQIYCNARKRRATVMVDDC